MDCDKKFQHTNKQGWRGHTANQQKLHTPPEACHLQILGRGRISLALVNIGSNIFTRVSDAVQEVRQPPTGKNMKEPH